MSNMPIHPGTDRPEPILPDEPDNDAVGQPLPDGDERNGDLPEPSIPDASGPDVVSPDPVQAL